MQNTKQQFIEFALEADVLRFGEFKTKAGRLSPYFFNAGLFNTGARLDRLGAFYAETLLAARKAGRLDFDMIFGPAYKGIPLAASVAMNLSRMGCDVPWAFNRKEIKDHGEGGMIVGAPLKTFGLSVVSIINLHDLLAFMDGPSEKAKTVAQYRDAVAAYRARYGA